MNRKRVLFFYFQDVCGACSHFQPGWLDLLAEWRGPPFANAWAETELVVWPRGHPEQKATLPVWPWTVGELEVRADGNPDNNLDVQFEGTSSFRCSDTTIEGQVVKIQLVFFDRRVRRVRPSPIGFQLRWWIVYSAQSKDNSCQTVTAPTIRG